MNADVLSVSLDTSPQLRTNPVIP